MKKIISFLLAFVLLFTVGCTKTEPTPSSSSNTPQTDTSEETKTVEVDKNLLSVEINIPASMVGEDPTETIESAKKDGIEDIAQNEDGSLTYKVTKAKYKELMAELKSRAEEGLKDISESGDYASIKDVQYNDDFSEINLIVEKASYEGSFDQFANYAIALMIGYYKIYEGNTDYKITINNVDEATQEVFKTTVYPDDLQQTDSE